MRISKQLGQTRVFVPPKAETATLISTATCALDDLGSWRRVFSSYIELCRASVWNGFVSDQELWEGSESLDSFKTIYIPLMIFEKERVAEQLIRFVSNGGTVVCADPRVFSYNLDGEDISRYRKKLFAVDGGRPRATVDKEVELSGELSGLSVQPYGPGTALTPLQGARVLGRYADGQAAVTVNVLGKGRAFLFGAPILDIYNAGLRSFDDIQRREDRARWAVYQQIQRATGAADHSWVWDITAKDLHRVTGWRPGRPPAPDESIRFE
jgi:hypothetical protein